MSKYGCLPKFIAMVKQFHDGMQSRVQDNGETSEPFPVTNGMKQRCVLAPSLFSLMFSVILTNASGGKVMTDIIRDFLFADDCALNAGSEADMQRSVDKFSDACNDFGLTISIKKTEVMHQPAPGKPYVEHSVTANGQRLNVVNRFTYLGSTRSWTLRSLLKEAYPASTPCLCSLSYDGPVM